MEDCFEGFSEDITKWEIIRELTDLGIGDNEPEQKNESGVQLLPRQDVMVYGIIPKMEQRVYSKCKECRLVFNPRDILSHKNCSGKAYYSNQNLKKKVKSKGISNKKPQSGIPPPPLFKKPPSPPAISSAAVTSVSASTSINTLPELKVSVTKVVLPKVSKSSIASSSTVTTTSTSHSRSDTRLSSSSTHNTKSSYHSSKSVSTTHSPRSSKAVASSHATKSSKSSSHSTRFSKSSLSHSPRSPSKSALTHSPTKSSGHSPKSPSKPESKSSPRSPSKSASSHSHSSSKSTSKTSDVSHSSSTHTHSSTSGSSSSSRHKKSRRSNTSNKVPTKEFDPDVHCGVIEGTRGPCTRSITCSNHRIQLRKLVAGRSKDIHQLIAERKAAKEKDLKSYTSSTSCSYTSPNGEEKEVFSPNANTSYVPIVAKIVSTIELTAPVTTLCVPMPKISPHSRHLTTSFLAIKKSNVIESEKDPFRQMTTGFTLPKTQNFENSSQESSVATVPVVYMPVSPISVVSSVQCVQIGDNMICLETPQAATSPPLKNKSVFLPLPCNSSHQINIRLYKSHPKPAFLPTFGTKKVGGSILVSNPRLESQRNELLNALNKRREKINHWDSSLLNHSTPHRPNILKSKNSSKQNCKRTASDKPNCSESKQIRLVPDVNGFILHADVSETADAPQSNDCLQEKITLLNMK